MGGQERTRLARNETGSESSGGDGSQRSADEHRRRAALAVANRVLAKCAANDSTVPKPNKPMALAWAECVAEAGLEYDEDLLLQAVTRVYSTAHSDGFRVRAWHVITAARELREEAAMREPAAVREARQDARDKMLAAAEDAADRAAVDDGMVPIRGGSPFTVACHHPPCSAPPGRPCTTPERGRDRERTMSWSRAHPNRIARAAMERERNSPQAQQAAAEAERQEQIRALARYRAHNPHEDALDDAERADLYREAEKLAEVNLDEREAS